MRNAGNTVGSGKRGGRCQPRDTKMLLHPSEEAPALAGLCDMRWKAEKAETVFCIMHPVFRMYYMGTVKLQPLGCSACTDKLWRMARGVLSGRMG